MLIQQHSSRLTGKITYVVEGKDNKNDDEYSSDDVGSMFPQTSTGFLSTALTLLETSLPILECFNEKAWIRFCKFIYMGTILPHHSYFFSTC